MKRQEQQKERKILVTLRSDRKEQTLETWRYWEIVGALQWMGADRVTAYDQAKYIQKAKPGDTWRTLPDIHITISEKEYHHGRDQKIS